MKIKTGGILDMSTVDYPGRLASVMFFYGCNFRCPFCYNTELVEGEKYIEPTVEEVLKRIRKNREFINAVVITGGEPTLQPEGLEEVCSGLKGLKLLVKLDTNGYNPDVVEKLLKKGLLDFVSMDIKTSPRHYNKLSGIECDITRIAKTIGILRDSETDYELRTTIIPGINDSVEEINEICSFIKPAGTYVLQQFRPGEGTLNKSLSNLPKMDRDNIVKLAETAKKTGLKVKIRTEEQGEEEL